MRGVVGDEAEPVKIVHPYNKLWGRLLVEEVRALAARGLREGRTASRALGYAQVLRHLAGGCSEDEAREDTVRATRRFARRQESWFRRDPRVHWLDVGAAEDVQELAERALSALGEMPEN